MKLDKRAVVLLACSVAFGSMFVGCKGKDDKDNDTGDGDGDGDGDMAGDGDGDGDGDAPLPTGPQCDEPGGAQCTGTASGIVCPSGSTDGVAFTCATGDVCDDGECVGQCDPGETECVGGSVLRVCTANGREWVNIPCQSGQVCEDGACGLEGGLECVPGTKDCDGDTARTCKSDGSGWDELECPGTTVCEEGSCNGSVCTVGDTKCDESTNYSALLFEGVEPNLRVLHRCVDGESWVAEPCPMDDDGMSYCTYDNFNRAEAARYRAEVNLWVTANLFEGPPSPAAIAAFPTPPVVPAGTTASCQAVPDHYTCSHWSSAFFESPVMSRQCEDPDYSDEEGEPYEIWKGYTECQGLPPFAPLQVVQNSCTGLSVCTTYQPQMGCVPVPCLPGETICDSEDDTGYNSCYYYGGGTDFSFFEYCPESASEEPGACTDSGSAPARRSSCDGEPVSTDPISWW